jgi:hypothetical protein
MPKSTFQATISAGAFRLLAAVRRIMRDGETRDDISNAQWARYAGIAESTVVSAMRELHEHGLIVRERLGDGRGRGYATTLLPPPEIVARQASLFDAPEKGSDSDPFDSATTLPAAAPQTPPGEGSESDPSILLIHDSLPPPTPPQSGGGGTESPPREEPTRTEAFLLDHLFNRKTAHEFRHLDYGAVRREVIHCEAHGQGPGAMVERWRVRPPVPEITVYGPFTPRMDDPSAPSLQPPASDLQEEPPSDPAIIRARLKELEASDPAVARLAERRDAWRREQETSERFGWGTRP